MRWSETFIHTQRQDPADAEVASHRLMVRAGLIAKLATGIYASLPLGWRVLRKLEAIIREEMGRAGSVELSLPAIQPAELWQESARWYAYGPELLRVKDRHQRELCFGPTHEEVITDVIRRSVTSYRQLPVSMFQIQVKFRDEVRPRFGLMRAREFLMMDAYSFHVDAADLDLAYRGMREAYRRIFARVGLDCVEVEADTGSIGGEESHEFIVLARAGEDAIMSCAACGYGANAAKATAGPLPPAPAWPLPEPAAPRTVATPGMRTVEEVAAFLGVASAHLVKTLLFDTEEGPAAALIRGDAEVNESKLREALGRSRLELASEAAIQRVTGGPVGFSGPVGLTGVRVVADPTVMGLGMAVTGANSADAHLVGVVPGRDFEPDQVADVRRARAGDSCVRCGQPLGEERGIEVGHVFKLGSKYSAPMGCVYLDSDGAERPMVMGCYGLGLGRTAAAAVEQGHDEAGICWPLALAPYEVALVLLNTDQEEVVAAAERLYGRLLEAGIDVLFDDRAERPGVKFADLDLIGFPVRLVVGRKGLADGRVELSLRRDRVKRMVPLETVIDEVNTLLDELRVSTPWIPAPSLTVAGPSDADH